MSMTIRAVLSVRNSTAGLSDGTQAERAVALRFALARRDASLKTRTALPRNIFCRGPGRKLCSPRNILSDFQDPHAAFLLGKVGVEHEELVNEFADPLAWDERTIGVLKHDLNLSAERTKLAQRNTADVTLPRRNSRRALEG